MKSLRKFASLLLVLCLVLGMAHAAFASTFTDAHGNVIELDDTLEAYSEYTLKGANGAAKKSETNLGDLWTDALRWYAVSGKMAADFDEDDIKAGNDKIDVDADHIVALWNAGNLKEDIPAGKFGAAELAKVLPYPNKVAVVYMTGAQLVEALEAASQGIPFRDSTADSTNAFMQVSGLKYTVDISKPYDAGEAYGKSWFRAASLGRVTINEVNGKPFSETDIYAVITSNANFNGMDSSYIFKEAAAANEKSTISTGVVRDVVWMYIDEELENVVGRAYASVNGEGRITICGNPFTDVDAKLAPAAEWAVVNGITEGTSATKFSPEKTLTRAQAVTFLWRAAGSPKAEGENPFEDVAEGAYYYDAVLWAVSNGITQGTTATTFRPELTINREMAMTFLYRYIKLQGGGFEGLYSFKLEAEDVDQISEYALEPISYAVMDGLFDIADGKIDPRADSPRSEIVTMLFRYFAR